MNVGTTLKAKHLRKPIWDGLIKPFISNLNKANTLPVRLSVDNVFDLTVDGSPAMLATSIADYCKAFVDKVLRERPCGDRGIQEVKRKKNSNEIITAQLPNQ